MDASCVLFVPATSVFVVQASRVPDAGVPNAPFNTTGAPALPTLIARAVATPVPKPVIPLKGTADAVPAV